MIVHVIVLWNISNRCIHLSLHLHPQKDIKEFIRHYQSGTVIGSYTRSSFVYETLNQALRLLDIEVLIAMGLFLNDLHQQIEQLHRNQLTQYHDKSFVVYRDQGLSSADYQKLLNKTTALISFDCFLSTSLDRTVSNIVLNYQGESGYERNSLYHPH